MATLTVYPDAGEGGANVTCDGVVRRTGTESWATKRDAADGTTVDNTGTTTFAPYIGTHYTSTNWSAIYRGGLTFDTSELGAGATISAATLGLRGTNRGSTLAGQTVRVVTFAPADNAQFATGDYDAFGTAKLSDTETATGSWITNNYNTFAFNATGIAAISKTGVTGIGLRISSDADDAEPEWSSSNSAYVIWRTADDTNETPPYLEITYTAGGGGTEYFRSASGTMTGTGTMGRIAGFLRSVSGAMTGTGALTRFAVCARSVTGAMTATGSAGRLLSAFRAVSGTLTGTGAVARLLGAKRSASGTLTGAGSVSRVQGFFCSVSGALTGTGAVSRMLGAKRAASGTMTGTGAVTRITGFFRSVSGALVGAGAVARLLGAKRSVSTALTGTGTVGRVAGFVRLVGATLEGVGSVAHDWITGTQFFRSVSATLTGTGAVSRIAGFKRSVTGALTGTGIVTRFAVYARSVTGALVGTGTVTRVFSGITQFYRSVTGNMIGTGSVSVVTQFYRQYRTMKRRLTLKWGKVIKLPRHI